MSKIRVLHIFYRLDQGGVENFVLNLFKNIDRERFEFCFAMISGEKGKLDDEVLNLGGKIYYFTQGKKNYKRIRSNLINILDHEGPFDVVHSHCYFFSGILLQIANKKGIPIRISHSHETYKGQKYSIKRYLYESLMRYSIERNATVKLGCSHAACIHLYKRIDDKTQVINNAIDVNKFQFDKDTREKVRQEMSLCNNIVLGHVGRFEDQKDHMYLVDVFNEVYKKNKRAKLMLIGEGSLREDVESKVTSLNLSDAVLFLGNRSDVNELMQAMDIFLLPSKYEGLPIVLVEAQMAGLYCIVSTDVSQEANISNRVLYLSKEDRNDWIESILKYKEIRYDNKKSIENSGYGIHNTVSKMEKIYRNDLK